MIHDPNKDVRRFDRFHPSSSQASRATTMACKDAHGSYTGMDPGLGLAWLVSQLLDVCWALRPVASEFFLGKPEATQSLPRSLREVSGVQTATTDLQHQRGLR